LTSGECTDRTASFTNEEIAILDAPTGRWAGSVAPMNVDSVSERRPVRGYYLDPDLLRLPGIDRNRAFLRGDTGFPAFHHLTGAHPTEASMGRSTFAMPATDWLANSVGIIPGGVLALLADAPLAGAIESVLGPNKAAASSEISITFVNPAFPGPGNLVARASVIDAGAQLGFSQAEILDQNGRLVAHATSRCVIVDVPDTAESGPRQVDPDWIPDDSPDPWTEPAQGELIPDLDAYSGRQALEMWIRDELPRPPLSRLLGHRPIAVTDDESVWTIPSSRWWSSPGPFLYGGALVALAEVAHGGAFFAAVPAGSMYANLDLKVQFVRPAFADSGPLTAIGRITHRGRSMLVATVEVTNSEGKTVLFGTGSAVVIPDGMALLMAQRRS
jgi:uncharacterized protein (TIGR00369 family)